MFCAEMNSEIWVKVHLAGLLRAFSSQVLSDRDVVSSIYKTNKTQGLAIANILSRASHRSLSCGAHFQKYCCKQ